MVNQGQKQSSAMDAFDPRTLALELCVKTLQVAKNQYESLKKQFFELHRGLRPEQLESQDHSFLRIPDIQDETDLEVVLRHLKKFHVCLKYMSEESPLSEEFTRSCVEASIQVLQLMECCKQVLPLLREDLDYDTIDEGEVVFPEDLKVETDASARQRRDFLVVRNYDRLLDALDNVISRYLIQ